jgi:acetyltransferase-like isoleucine patch superfamily enzyme
LGEIWIQINSFIVKSILKAKGIKVGKNFKILGKPYLKLNAHSPSIILGDNISIAGNIDLRIRENGKIIIHDNTSIDDGCRFVAANDAVLEIGKNCSFSPRSIFNCGASVEIGNECLFGANILLNSSEHIIDAGKSIKEQGYRHSKIKIGEGVFFGGNTIINPGVNIGKNAVIGANSVVTKDIEDNSINIGSPTKKIRNR